MRPGNAIRAILISFLLLALESSCASFRSSHNNEGKPGEKFYAVSSEAAAFYFHSPRQDQRPDKTLVRDTPMKLIRSSFAFCKVQLLTGEKGYVSNDDISSAPPTLVASLASPAQTVAASEWRAEIPEPRSNAPLPPLPEFEPTPIPDP